MIALSRTFQFQQLSIAWEKALLAPSTYKNWQNVLIRSLELRDYDSALQAAEKCLRIIPGMAQYQMKLDVLLISGRLESATYLINTAHALGLSSLETRAKLSRQKNAFVNRRDHEIIEHKWEFVDKDTCDTFLPPCDGHVQYPPGECDFTFS